MKGNKKILIVAILVLLITISFTTYAIYKSSASANGQVTAATWNVVFKNGSEPITGTYNLTFSGSDCDQANDGENDHVAEGKIAPGVTCTKTINVDATGSEVDVKLTATAGNITATKNSESVATTGANEFTVTATPSTEVIAYNASSKEATVAVNLTWAGTTSDTVDPADTLLNGATITVPITLTAQQYLGGQ